MNSVLNIVFLVAVCLVANTISQTRNYRPPQNRQYSPPEERYTAQRDRYTPPRNGRPDDNQYNPPRDRFNERTQNRDLDYVPSNPNDITDAPLNPDQRPHSNSLPTDGFICPKEDGLFAHPSFCNTFINCAIKNKDTFVQQCPPGLVFNAQEGYCDFDYNVDCEGKAIIEIVYKKPEIKKKDKKPEETMVEPPPEYRPPVDDLPPRRNY